LWLQKLERNPAPARRLAPLYLREFSSRSDLISGAGAAVRSMSRLGLRLGVVTNGIDLVQRRRLKASELRDAFPVIVTSERAGFTKPDPRIIELALRRLRVSAEETLYVGDDPHVDGLAANRASVPFVWFNPAGVPSGSANGVKIDHEIVRLQEIHAVIRLR
jgi:HAD superfamily hydrolase (TIGR01549 family)